MTKRTISAAWACVALFFGAPVAQAETETHGTLNWETGSADLTRVECGEYEDKFILRGRGDGVRLRVVLDADAMTATNVSLHFVGEHDHARALFQMFAALGDIGPVLATRNEAVGQAHLRAANGDAADLSAGGLTVDFTVTCTHPLT